MKELFGIIDQLFLVCLVGSNDSIELKEIISQTAMLRITLQVMEMAIGYCYRLKKKRDKFNFNIPNLECI